MYRATLRRTIACALLLGTLGWVASPALPAHAATDMVSVCDESHLRSAISAALPGDTVSFGCSGTITLTSGGGGTIILSKNLTIDGPGNSVTISGGRQVQVFSVSSTANVTLNYLTISGGSSGAIYSTGTLSVSHSLFIGNSASSGGGGAIDNHGTLTVSNSTFSENGARGGGGAIFSTGTLTVSNSTFSRNSTDTRGGGIYNYFGTLTVSNSTFSSNSIFSSNSTFIDNSGGGGIYNFGGTLTVGNSTFSGNSADTDGGGIYNFDGRLAVGNSTFSGNSAYSGGGGIYNNSGTLAVGNSTFSGNSAEHGTGIGTGQGSSRVANTLLAGPPGSGDCSGPTPADGGGNLADDASCGVTRVSTASLNLGALASNGGPTQTIKLLPGSRAIAAGVSRLCNAAPIGGMDQRGFPRPSTSCDSGAYDTDAATGPAGAPAKWYSDGGVDAGFLQQAGLTLDRSLSSCPGLRSLSGDLNHDGLADLLVYCPSTGAFQKLYGTGGIGSQFTVEPVQYVGNAPGAWTNIQMAAADFNGDGRTDILVYRTDTGAYAKWYSDGGVDAGFTYEPTRYVGNAPGAWTNVRMVPADFNGDGRTDILVYRPDTGDFQKWYSDGGVDAGFTYEPTQYVGGAPGAWTNIQMAAADFNGDGKMDILVYRTDNGAYVKWYSDGGVDAGFIYEPAQYVGGAPGAWTNVQMVPADFNGDGRTDLLVSHA